MIKTREDKCIKDALLTGSEVYEIGNNPLAKSYFKQIVCGR